MSNKIKQILTEWTIDFIKNKNSFLNTLKKIEKNKEEFDLKVIYQDKEEYILIEPENKISELNKEKNIILFLFNTKENINLLIENWKKFTEYDKLTIYFVNMFSLADKKWVIKPHFHSKISDEKFLKKGLSSIYSTVDLITKEELEKIT
jgi:hypothetical protein